MIYFFQIYWDEEQRKQFFSFTTPYHNKELTPFFENTVILDVFDRYMFNSFDKIGVFSWNLRNKMRQVGGHPEKITKTLLESDYDVLAFNKMSQGHGMLQSAEVWHPGFRQIVDEIWIRLGFRKPFEAKYPIYQNAFMARYDVYKAYIEEVLKPATELMKNDPEVKKLCWQDSKYYKLKNNPEFAQRVKQFLGIDYCPLHPFLCERFFSLWLNDKNIKPIYL